MKLILQLTILLLLIECSSEWANSGLTTHIEVLGHSSSEMAWNHGILFGFWHPRAKSLPDVSGPKGVVGSITRKLENSQNFHFQTNIHPVHK